jgi:hypothetical protein
LVVHLFVLANEDESRRPVPAMTTAQVRRCALSLPEATEEPHFKYTSFRVRGKIFATIPPDADHMHIFVGEQVREEALAAEPDFLEELRWGKKVVGLRVLLTAAKPGVVHELLREAWLGKAPKRLVAAFAARDDDFSK